MSSIQESWPWLLQQHQAPSPHQAAQQMHPLNAPTLLPLPDRGPWLQLSSHSHPHTGSGALDPSLHALSWVHPRRGGFF